VQAFKQEVVFYKDRFNRFDSLYVGGGTPTILDAGVLKSVMDQVFMHFDFDPNSEITIEANPCDLTIEKIWALKDMGFNRVSLGVQSFDDRILSFLGRKHTAKQAEDALTDLRTFGFNNISIDLIYGFRGQSKENWMNTLDRAVTFAPEHLSCYQLSVEKRTLFGHLMHKGLFQPLGEKQESAYFLTTSQFLEKHGYIHYEISSFARDGSACSRHNYKYWQHAPYLGLGPSAHSFYEKTRWWNARSVRKYCEALEGGRRPVDGSESLTDEQLRFESILLGLRIRDGCDQRSICENQRSEGVIAKLRDSGFLRINNGRITPTTRGFMVADYLACCVAG